MDYKNSGVDIHEGYKAVELMKKYVSETYDQNVMMDIGSFGALYRIPGNEKQVLAASTDGVGTKLDLAFMMKKYDTVGIDCVAMCVNDILCLGAKPLFFLDYIACGKLDATIAADLVKGVAKGCIESGSALIGGETAEMPGFYDKGKYDIAGFSVGIADKKNIIDGSFVKKDDILIGLASTGPHSNGYSFIRKILKDNKLNLNNKFENKTLGETLLAPTRIYVKPLLEALEKGIGIHGMSNITGGGFYENIPRMFKSPFTAFIDKNKLKIPPIFPYLQSFGVTEKEMFSAFNNGTGFVCAVKPSEKDIFIKHLNSYNIDAFEIGIVQEGKKETIIKGID